MDVRDLRRTSDDSFAGAIRMALGVLFLMTGVMKLAVPMLADAFSGQLVASGIPMIWLAVWAVPIIEIGAGLVLLIGAFTRVVALVIMGIMSVAAYVHMVVDDPSMFPLQPNEPVVPLVVMAMATYLVWRGGGSGSIDLRDVPRTR
ncbi:MAG: DoxX family protein [Gemmatimonadetes bacterium]|nr:DoxX family protein [Gemmatimonadota bacterium]MCK5482844.1 DoxX family protein [Gemmatimonadota bacterium]